MDIENEEPRWDPSYNEFGAEQEKPAREVKAPVEPTPAPLATQLSQQPMPIENPFMVPSRPQAPTTAMTQVDQSRAIQEVQAAVIMAKKFPRDMNAAYTRIIESCRRSTLANQSVYAYPRAGQTVSGPSIRLAEVLAQNYGNLQFGVKEIERHSGKSVAESYCWDLETNVRESKVFEVPHEVQLKGGKMKRLTDPRDIYEIVANNGARRLRACILGIIPGDIVEAAVMECRRTMAKGGGEPLGDRIRKAVLAYKELGITQAMIEERLGHEIGVTTGEELVELQAIYTSIRDKQSKRSDFFNVKEAGSLSEEQVSVAEKINSLGKNGKGGH
jgi:hypothetical protein